MSARMPASDLRRALRHLRYAAASVLVLAAPLPARANPVGGTVVGGEATIATTAPNTVTIDQSTKIVIVDWNNFNIAKGETTQFKQPDGSSIAINRIGGSDPTTILGDLKANGRIVVINGNGLLFGDGASVNVGSLIATTHDASNADLMTGKADFTGAGNPLATVVNNGQIEAAGQGGIVGLIAPAVANNGTIRAKLGSVTLGAATKFTLDFSGDGLLSFPVDSTVLARAIDSRGKPVEALVVNNGQIEGRTVLLAAHVAKDLAQNAVSMGGLVRATAAHQVGGTIVLDGGDGGVSVTGTLDASARGAGQVGGTVKVLGDQVALAGGAKLDVSGDAGGGTVLVGGNAQGAGPERNATTTTVAAGASIKADAIAKGNGGKVVVWANGSTSFNGAISAKGGAAGGHGGSVETSGKHQLAVGGSATVDTLAPQGEVGDWLLDPATITVAAAGAGTLAQAATTSDTASAVTISSATINAAASNVVLAASTSVAVNSAINIAAAGVGLTIEGAGTAGQIAAGPTGGTTLAAGITTNGGTVLVDGPLTISANTTIAAGSGGITLAGAVNDSVANTHTLALTTTGATLFGSTVGATNRLSTLTVSGGTATLDGSVTTGGAQSYGGALTVSGLATLTTTNSTIGVTGATVLGANATLAAGTGSVSFTGTVDGPGSLTRTGTGTTGFGSTVGATTALAGLSTGAGTTTLAGAVTTVGAQSYGGALTLNGPSLTTTNGAITVTGATALGANETVSAGTGTVTFTGTVNGAKSLTLSGTGADVFATTIGATTALTSLATGSGTTTLGGTVTTSGTQSYGGGLNLNAGTLTTTNSAVSVTGATVLGANTTVAAGTATVTFGGTVDGAKTLTRTGTGAMIFGGMVGGVTALSSLVTGTGTTTVGGGVTTTGVQTYGGALNLNGSTLTTTNSAVSVTGATALGANATVAAGTGTVTFTGTVNGAESLTLSGTGADVFGTTVGATTALTSLATGSGTTTLSGNVTTVGAQSYGGALTLNAATLTTTNGTIGVAGATTLGANETLAAGSGLVTLTGAVNGAKTLAVTGSGGATFGTAVGTTTALASLAVTGPATLGGSVTTTGTQSYGGALTVSGLATLTTTNSTIGVTGATVLGANATLAAGTGSVSFTGTVDGPGSLTRTGTGTTGFGATVGATTALAGLSTGAGTTTLAGAVTTVGAQSYGGALTLNGPSLTTTNGAITVTGATALGANETVSAGTGTVTFTGTVNGAKSLTLSGTGADVFATTIGATTALTSLATGSGTTTLGGTVTTSGTQSYGGGLNLNAGTLTTTNSAVSVTGATVLGANTTVAAGTATVTFGGTVDGAKTLTRTGTGAMIFGGTVGGVTALSSLVTGTGTTTVGGGVTTTGVQTYGGALNLNGSTLTTTNSAVTVTGATALGANATVAAGTGTVTFTGTVNGAESLTLSGTGADVFGTTVGATTALTSLATGSGTTTLAGNVTTVGAQSYGGALTLNAATLTTTNGTIGVAGATTLGANETLAAGSGLVTLTGAVNGAKTLAVTGSGGATFGTAVGTTTALASLAVTGPATLGGSVTTTGTQSYGGALTVSGLAMLTTTNSTIGVTGATVLGANATLAAGTGSVSFTGTVDGPGSLTRTGTGTTGFGATVGATTALAGLSTGAGTTTLAGAVTTVGAQSYGGALTLNGPSLTTTNGAITVTGATALGANETVSAGTGTVTFTGTVNGAKSLTLSGTGADVFATTIGATTALTSLATGSGTTTLGGTVTTSGTQSYGGGLNLNAGTLTTTNSAVSVTGATVLGANTTVAAGTATVTFGGTVDGAKTLTRTGTGAMIFGGTVGGVTALSSLVTGTGTTTVGGGVTTTGVQTYGGALNLNGSTLTTTNSAVTVTGATALGANATVAAGTGTVTFTGTVNGAESLTLSGTGADVFGTTVGATTALTSLATGSGTTTLAGNVTTVGAQSYGGALTLNAATLTTTNGTIGVAGATTLGANETLAAGSGLVTLTGAVNGAKTLAVTGSGGATFGTAVGTTTALASLAVTGPATLGGSVTTTGTQSYGGALTVSGLATLTTTNSTIGVTGATVLGANATLAAGTGSVSFTGTVDGPGSLTRTGTGTTGFGATVGATTALAGLSTGAGTTTLAGAVTTVGAQSYGGALTLNGPSLTTTNGAITVTGATALGANETVSAGTGTVTFTGTVNGAKSLTLSGTGADVFATTIGATTALTSLATGSGTTTLGGTVTTAGTQHYGGVLVLDAPALTTSNATITVAGATVLGVTATLTAGTGGITLSGAVNDTTAGSHNLSLSSAGAESFGSTVGATTPLASLATGTGTITLGGNVTTIGSESFGGPVILAGNTVLGSGNGAISFASTIDADSLAHAWNLTVSSGGGAQSYDGALGATAPLGGVTLTSSNAGGLSLGAAANHFASITIAATGPVTVANGTALTVDAASANGDIMISTETGNLTVVGPVTTLSTSATALTLAAGRTADRVAMAGDSDSAGNVLINGGTLSVGTGGIGRIYTGSIADSTGVAAAAGAGHFRYWSDTNGDTGYTTALGTGINAIYREQPIVTVTAAAAGSGRIYNASTTTPTLTTTGQINGDSGAGTGTIGISGAGAALLNAGGYMLTVTGPTPGAALGGLGYAAAAGANASYAIVAAVVTVDNLVAQNKIYDSTTTATLSSVGQLSGLVGGETLTVTAAAANFSDKNAGTGKTVTVTGYALSNGTGLASNYQLSSTTATTTADITPAVLTAGLTGTVEKGYDSTAAASLAPSNYTLTGTVYGGDTVSLNNPAAGLYADKNAGTGKIVTVAGLALDNPNYVLSATGAAAAIGVIDPAVLTAGLTGTVEKGYDSTAAASLAPSNYTLTGTVYGGDTVSLNNPAAGLYADKNAGTGKIVTVSGLALDNPNYVLSATGAAAAIGVIDPAVLTAGLTGTVEKGYDSTAAASLAPSNYTLTGTVYSGDTVALNNPTAGLYADKNAGTGKIVTVAGLALDNPNYVLSATGAAAAIGVIDPAVLTAGLTGTVEKGYDGTAAATLAASNYTVTGTVYGGDTVSLNNPAAGLYADKNAGTGKIVTVSGLALDNGNYMLAANSVGAPVGVIDPAVLTAGLTGTVEKGYDGTAAATLAASNYTVTGTVYGGDTVALNNPTAGLYADKNAGTGKIVTVSGLALDNPNYVLSATGAAAAIGVIDPAVLTAGLTGTVEKGYDSTAAASLAPSNYTLTGTVYSGDTVALNNPAAGLYADKNAGTGKIVTVAGLALDNPNYVLSATGATAAIGVIDPAVLTAGLTGTVEKGYDSTAAATLAASNYTLTGTVYGGDTVSLNNPTAGLYADKNAGTGKIVTVAGLALDNPNYVLSATGAAAAIGVIDPAVLTAGLTGTVEKGYDSTAAASLAPSNYTLTGTVYSGDTVALNNPAAGLYADKNAGTGKIVTVSGLALDNPNYVLSATGAAAAIGVIDPAVLTAGLTGTVEKGYDSTAAASLAPSNYTLTGTVYSGDTVALNNPAAGLYADKNAGTGKIVTVAGLALDNPNYVLSATGATAAIGVIDPAVLTAGLTGTVEKGYDSTAAATLAASNYTLTGTVYGGDTVSLNNPTAGLYADKNAGTGKIVTVAGLALDNPNYVLSATGAAAAIGVIDPAVLTAGLTGTVEKGYDSTAAASLAPSNYTLTGTVYSGDTVALNNPAAGLYADKNAGTGKIVTVSGLALDNGNYMLAANSVGAPVGVIDPAVLTAGLTGTVEKSYDSTAAATLAASNYTVTGTVYGGDTVSLNNPAAGLYADKNAGTGKIVTVSGLALDNPNYVLSATGAAAAIGVIDPAVLTAGLTGTVEKSYDGTAAATLAPANYTLTGTVYGGDMVSLNNPTAGLYADKNAGTGKTVSATGLALDNPNYTLVSTSIAGGIGIINPAPLTVTVNDAVRLAGENNPAFTVALTGSMATDGPPVLSGLTITTAATTTSPAGTYVLTSAGGTAPDYFVAKRIDGTLTILQAPVRDLVNITTPGYGATLAISSQVLQDDVIHVGSAEACAPGSTRCR